MKRLIVLLLGALALCLPSAPSYAQTVSAVTVSACGTPGNTPVVGTPYPLTQDTTRVLCTNASGGGGGGGVAGLTAEATANAVAAGTNKPQSEDTVNGAARVEICDAGSTNCITASSPSGIKGTNGSSIATPTNPLDVQNASAPCPNTIAINQTTGTDLHTFTNTGYLCSVFIANATSTQGWSLAEGTGSICGTGTAFDIGGSGGTAQGSMAQSGAPVLIKMQAAAKHLCLLQSGSTNLSGFITYVDK